MQIKENVDVNDSKLSGIALILASIPKPWQWMVVVSVPLGIVALIYLMRGYLDACEWVLRVGLVLGIVLLIIQLLYRAFMKDVLLYHMARNAREASNQAVLTTATLASKLKMIDILPSIAIDATRQGHNISYGGLKIASWKSNVTSFGSIEEVEQKLLAPVPTLVKYEDIRNQIPEGHNLVGVGAGGTIITKEDSKIGACVWICGLSGSGKTSSTSARVEERAACGHKFLGVDPHWFKDDSLTNAIVGYSDKFIRPIARNIGETRDVLKAFLAEFKLRKSGGVTKPFQKITLLVDEVNSFMDPTEDEEAKEVQNLLKVVSRICGQEARNFQMGGIFVSQKATGLYWLRDVALLIIIHKLIMESQQKIATNLDNKEFFEAMRVWPVGRTFVYGAGLESGEGCITVQQPLFKKEPIGEWLWEEREEIVKETEKPAHDIVYEACMLLKSRGVGVSVRALETCTPYKKTRIAEILNDLEKQGCDVR